MSQPKRYIFVHIGRDVWMHEPDNRMEAAPAGEYVSASDYAALAAENERRTEQLKLSMSMTDSCIDNINRLTAENERLRKAGDAFFDSVIGYYGEHILEDEKHSSGQKCRDWLAAKEGRDAK